MDRQILTEDLEDSRKEETEQYSPSSEPSEEATVEYHSSANLSHGDEDEDSVSIDLPVKTSGLHNLKFTKSSRLLIFYGVTSLLLGAVIACCGIVSFTLLPTFRSRYSFQIESKWTNIVLIFSGCGALLLVYKKTLTSMCATLVFSIVAAPIGFCTMIVHIVNLHFRSKDMQYYKHSNPEQFQAAVAIGNINVALIVAGGVSCVISFMLYRHTLHIAGKNFGYAIQMDKRRMTLSMVGMGHIFCGVFITGFWIAIETLLMALSFDFHALPTSEVLSHGLVICAAGYIQMMATSKGNQPMIVCCGVLNAVTLLLVCFFTAHPLSLIYMLVDIGKGTSLDILLDMRLFLLGALALVYVIDIILSTYSLIKFVHLAAGDKLTKINNLSPSYSRPVQVGAWIQITVGVVYALAELFGVSMFYLYKLDFTPLPVFIIVSGVFANGSIRAASAQLMAITSSLCCLCCSLAFRDIFLFVYHMMFNGMTPDNPTDDRMTQGNVTVHVLIAVLAVVECILSSLMLFLFMRTSLASVACLYNRMQFPRTLRLVHSSCVVQLALGVVILCGGIVLVFSDLLFLEVYGDMCVTVGLLLTISGVVQVASGSRPGLLLPAVFSQVQTLAIVWVQLDAFTFLIHNYLGDNKQEDDFAQQKSMLGVAFCTFVCIVLYVILSGGALFLYGSVLGETRFFILETNKDKIEQMVNLGEEDNEKDTGLLEICDDS